MNEIIYQKTLVEAGVNQVGRGGVKGGRWRCEDAGGGGKQALPDHERDCLPEDFEGGGSRSCRKGGVKKGPYCAS
eukprot:scaffold10535_cov106-Isochrysis_galbana.AAC.1